MKLFFARLFLGIVIGLTLSGIYLMIDSWQAFIYFSTLAGFCTGWFKLYRSGSYLALGYGLAWLVITHNLLQSLLMGGCFLVGFSILYTLLHALGLNKTKTP